MEKNGTIKRQSINSLHLQTTSYILYAHYPCVKMVKPDILVSIHGSVPGSFPQFQNPDNILDGVHKCVVVTR